MRQNIKIWKKQQIFPSFWQKKLGDTISLCMIMKNEEKRLTRCLKSVKGLVDEIIICDTGSTDKSIQIARAHGARIFQDPWQDDFSRPRNIAIAAATMNYILILDPDEVISHIDHSTLREHTRHPEIIAWRMDTRNYTDNPWQQNTHRNPGDFLNAKNFYGFVPSIKTRFFQNHKNIFFQKIWHELLDYDILKYKYKLAASPVPVHHYPGEINQASIEEKRKFYLRLGRKKAGLDPKDCQAQWELAVAEHIAGNHGRAYKACLLSLRNGVYGSDRLYFLAALARAKGGVKEHRLIFEKAVCKTYPNLTHINPVDKTPLHEAPKKPEPFTLNLKKMSADMAKAFPAISDHLRFSDPMKLTDGKWEHNKEVKMSITDAPPEVFPSQEHLQKKPKKRIKHHTKKPNKKGSTQKKEEK